jgi:hypothetical protein
VHVCEVLCCVVVPVCTVSLRRVGCSRGVTGPVGISVRCVGRLVWVWGLLAKGGVLFLFVCSFAFV